MFQWGGRKWGLTGVAPVQGRFILVLRNHYTTGAVWVTYAVGVSLFSLCTRHSFPPVTCCCKKAKDWIKLQTSLPFIQHQITRLCTHTQGTNQLLKLLAVIPKLSKPHPSPSLPTYCLYFSKMWGHKFAFQIKNPFKFLQVLLIYYFHVIKGLLAWAGGQNIAKL